MRTLRLLVLISLTAASTHAAAQPTPIEKPSKIYPDSTIHMSWVTLDYLQRCILSNGRALEPLYPGSKQMGVFLSQNMVGGGSPLSYFSITFRPGTEGARFKHASDPSASVQAVAGWTPQDVQAVAAVCEAAILRRVEINGRKKFTTAAIADAWVFTKAVAGDSLVPHKEAAVVTVDFLKLVQDAAALNGLDVTAKGEITEFKKRFKPGSPLKAKLDILIDPKARPDKLQPAADEFNAAFRIPLRPPSPPG